MKKPSPALIESLAAASPVVPPTSSSKPEAFVGGKRRCSAGPEYIPRNINEMIGRIIQTVKTIGTRLSVHLRGWDTLRVWMGSAVRDPPDCKICISAGKSRVFKLIRRPL